MRKEKYLTLLLVRVCLIRLLQMLLCYEKSIREAKSKKHKHYFQHELHSINYYYYQLFYSVSLKLGSNYSESLWMACLCLLRERGSVYVAFSLACTTSMHNSEWC